MGTRAWILFSVLTLALMGAKATFLPVLGAGLVLTMGVELVRNRRWHRRAFWIAVVVGCELVFAQWVLFGGASQGLALHPGDDFARVATWLGLPSTGPAVAVTTAAVILGWLAPLLFAFLVRVPAVGLRPPALLDPAVLLISGMALGSILPVLVLAHPGFSQYFFLGWA